VGVLAQRLIRILCQHCKNPVPATHAECALMGIAENPAPTIYHAIGCEYCRHSGYSGRSGVYELIAIDDKLRTMIHDRQPEPQLKKHARTLFPSIRQDGYKRVLAGHTSLEEVLRVTSEE
jgi:general secretion pathway protein E